MTEIPPVVYLFHGENEYSIAQSLSELETRLGDAATAALNTTRLDGRTAGLEEIRMAAGAMPFLADRRMVIVDHPLARLTTPTLRDKFTSLLDGLQATTALVLVEHRTLGVDERGKPEKKDHWLIAWAKQAGPRAFVKAFSLLKPEAMADWIQGQVKSAGGKFTPQAAFHLASLVGDDTRLAYNEIQKLLAYTGGRRPVEVDDVQLLTVAGGKLEDFALPNALRDLDQRKALKVLHRMLEDEDPIMILGSVARQIRLLLLARGVLDRGGSINDVISELTHYSNLKISAYPARLAGEQARRMTSADLELLFRRLLEIDEAVKTGQMDPDLALDLFVTSFTTRQA